ncbi:MAG: cupin domain-containing protein [Oceanospirillaceae bacterium]|nr:cupin domain-containing protein [Oceanospirillaceae bacterium]
MSIETRNLLKDLPSTLPEELFETLLQRRGLRLERILSLGHQSEPGHWYDQRQDEWVLLLSGKATLEFDDGAMRELVPGDAVLLPARCRHRVASTDPEQVSVWLALHLDAEQPHGDGYDDEE